MDKIGWIEIWEQQVQYLMIQVFMGYHTILEIHFPFPGARYTDYTIASTPSVPSGWYVAPGFGFYTSSKMPTPDDPMQLCTQ